MCASSKETSRPKRSCPLHEALFGSRVFLWINGDYPRAVWYRSIRAVWYRSIRPISSLTFPENTRDESEMLCIADPRPPPRVFSRARGDSWRARRNGHGLRRPVYRPAICTSLWCADVLSFPCGRARRAGQNKPLLSLSY